MSITIDMPPAMEREAREYTMLEGESLQQMFLSYLQKEFERRRRMNESARTKSDFSRFAGRWTADEARAFDKATERTIDESDWK